jgi:membrane protein YdbS with pleckstrin-like domain
MRPDPGGFLVRYLLAFAPLVVLIISLATLASLSGFVEGFNASLPGQVRAMITGMNELMEMSVLLTAPVGVYLVFVIIGWKMKVTELWTGSGLALGFAFLAGLLFVTFSPDPALGHLLDFLYWIAYLIAPASIAATLILIAWAEMFRRSISYTFTGGGILTVGGIRKRQESLLPYHQIGKVVVEQGPVARLLHVGTIIPLGMASGNPAAGKGRGKEASWGGIEASHHPLDCLYGISNPEKVGKLLEQLISLQSEIKEERPPETRESPGSP